MSKNDKPELALTVSGRAIELPRSAGGTPVAEMSGGMARDEAAARIRRGELVEALVWIERIHPSLDGLVSLFERRV